MKDCVGVVGGILGVLSLLLPICVVERDGVYWVSEVYVQGSLGVFGSFGVWRQNGLLQMCDVKGR